MSYGRGAPPSIIHLIEPGGRGGVYQHTIAVAEAISDSGLRVVLHTARDAELAARGDVVTCGCVDWHRAMRGRARRRGAITASYLGRTVPHLASKVRQDDIVHFQGWFKGPLSLLTMDILKCRARRLVFSPHNTFMRSDGRLSAALLRQAIRSADQVVVFSAADAEVVGDWGVRAVVSPLSMPIPVRPDLVTAWRSRWANGAASPRIALFAGQVRPDKRLDLAIRAAARWSSDCRLAVVGEDKGDVGRCRRIAADHRVDIDWSIGYLELDDFVSAIAAADIVICPYDRASQSAVVATATQLGIPSVVRNAGGLSELATCTVEGDDPAVLASAIDATLAGATSEGPGCSGMHLLTSALATAYAL